MQNIIFKGQRFFDLKKNEETTIHFFGGGIRSCQIIAPLEAEQHIRINYGGKKAAEDEYSYMYDSLSSSFEVIEDTPYRELSLLANVDVKIQLVNPRSEF